MHFCDHSLSLYTPAFFCEGMFEPWWCLQFCHADVSVDVTLFLLGGGVSKSRVLLNSLQQGSLNSVCLHFTTAVKMFLNMVHLPPKAIMRVASPLSPPDFRPDAAVSNLSISFMLGVDLKRRKSQEGMIYRYLEEHRSFEDRHVKSLLRVGCKMMRNDVAYRSRNTAFTRNVLRTDAVLLLTHVPM